MVDAGRVGRRLGGLCVAMPHPPIAGVALRAAAVDVDDILEFWRQAAEDTDRPAHRSEAVEALIARDPAALLLAVQEEAILGCVIVGWDGWRAHLYRVAVHPSHRRRGLASWLLTAAEQQLREHGAIRIDAMVIDSNDAGHAIWSAGGYTRQESWSRWVKPLRADLSRQASPSATQRALSRQPRPASETSAWETRQRRRRSPEYRCHGQAGLGGINGSDTS